MSKQSNELLDALESTIDNLESLKESLITAHEAVKDYMEWIESQI